MQAVCHCTMMYVMEIEGLSMVIAITAPLQHTYYKAEQNQPVPRALQQAASTRFARDGMRGKERRERAGSPDAWSRYATVLASQDGGPRNFI